MFNSKIVATGSYLPEKIYTNDYLSTIVETSDDWITERTGIKERHIVSDEELTSDLAYSACIDLLDNCNIDKHSIDAIILATTTPDRILPSTAAIVQKKLGITNNCFCFDIQAVCSGFAYALSVADNFIKSGTIKKALVIGAESMSKIVDWTDRNTCVLFGDGAGAVLLEATENTNEGILATSLHCNGEYMDLLKTSGGICLDEKCGYIEMQGREVFKLAVNKMFDSIQESLQKANLILDDIDLLIPHQANKRILDSLAKKLGVSEDKVIVTLDKQGNTSAASIPLAIDYANKNNKLECGDIFVIESLGGGLTWGSAVIKW